MGLNMPITLVLDNARYQKCKLVDELAKSLEIELLYLPSYSPNLNLRERLGKFIKKKCFYSKYYTDFSGFKAAISDLLAEAHITYKQDARFSSDVEISGFQETTVNHNGQSPTKARSLTVLSIALFCHSRKNQRI